MNDDINHERILIAVALALCAGIMCYNFFFVPSVLPPTVIYVDKQEKNVQSADNVETKTSAQSVDESNEQVTDHCININTATAEEMADALPRVGKSVANRIVDYRTQNGPFKKIEDIKNVKGIGEKNFEKMRDMICV